MRDAHSGQGMRAVDPRRDLSGLADVIEIAFAGSLDPSGRRMAEEMRRYGRLGWFGWLIGHFLLPPAAYPRGYVWIEHGRLVGNASLMPVQGAVERWVLANVAVVPEFRRRGIARALIGNCLDLARSERAREVVLQVNADNASARDLYRQFGFVERGTRVTWRLSGRIEWPATALSPAARPRRREEWQAHWDLARRLAPVGLVWPHPLRRSQLQPAARLGMDGWSHWVWPSTGLLQAAISGRGGGSGGLPWVLLCEPQARGVAEIPLLERALRTERGAAEVLVESEAGQSDESFRRLGFSQVHRLTWMTVDLAPAARASGA